MRPLFGLLIAVMSLTVACGSNGSTAIPTAPTPTTVTASPSQTSSAQVSPLVGDWDSGRRSISEMRAAVAAAGFTTAEFDAAFGWLGFPRAWELHLRFYEEGGVPYVVKTGWDPSKGPMPGDGDHGPYKLLADGRVLFTSPDHPGSQLFSYRIKGSELTIHAIRGTPSLTPRQLRADNAEWAAVSPLTKVS